MLLLLGDCRYAECRSAKRIYGGCCFTECSHTDVAKVCIIRASAFMLSASHIFILASVVAPNVTAPPKHLFAATGVSVGDTILRL